MLARQTRGMAVFAYDHGHAEPAANEERFIAEIAGGALRIDKGNAAGGTAVTAGEDIESDAASLQQLAEKNHKGSFSRAPD